MQKNPNQRRRKSQQNMCKETLMREWENQGKKKSIAKTKKEDNAKEP